MQSMPLHCAPSLSHHGPLPRFHPQCLGLTAAEVKNLKSFVCPPCVAAGEGSSRSGAAGGSKDTAAAAEPSEKAAG